MKQRLLRRDMGYRLDEFDSTLRGGFCATAPVLDCSGHAGDWRITGADGVSARLRAAPLPPRRLGMLELPRLQLELDIRAPDDAGIDAFLKRFHQHFHKGGG